MTDLELELKIINELVTYGSATRYGLVWKFDSVEPPSASVHTALSSLQAKGIIRQTDAGHWIIDTNCLKKAVREGRI